MAQTKFNFVGTIMLPKEGAKRPFIKEMEKHGRHMLSMNFGVKESDNNMAFVEMFGSEQDVIKTMNVDGEAIEVKWKDRFDESVVSIVSNLRKTTVDLGEEFGGRKEFLSTYDAIQFVADKIPEYKGKVCVTGQMDKQWYKDKYYDKFVIQNIYAINEDRKNRLTVIADIYYNRDSVDKDDWKSDKRIALDGYIQQYINKDEGMKYVPHRFIFNASKYDPNDEHHQNLLTYKLKYIDISKKTMQRLQWECVLINGSERIDFDESQLTKAQKEQIELGVRTLDDFRPAGSIFGERINEYRLFDPKLTGIFADGLVDTEMSVKEFEELIYVPPVDEKLDDVVKKAEKSVDEEIPFKEEPEVSDDDLF